MPNEPEILLDIDERNFQEKVVNNPNPVVVIFSTSWSGYTYLLQAAIGNIALRFSKRVDFFNIDIELNPEMARRFGIVSLPTILFFRAGEVVDYFKGALPEAEIVDKINRLLRN